MPIIHHEYINNNIIGVWKITETEEELRALLPQDGQDLKVVNRISHPRTRVQKLASRALAKELCSLIKYPYSCVLNNSKGKPSLEDCNLEISISHGEDYASAIIGPHDVGIDIQQYTDKIHNIKNRVFNPDEIELTQNDPMLLIVLWGFKETLYKLYSNRELTFKRDILIKSLNTSTKTGTTVVGVDGDFKTYTLKYEQIEDHILTYNL